jgi:hypothetical protein
MKVREILDTIYCYKSCSLCKEGEETESISGVTFIDVSRAERLYPDDAERYDNFAVLTKLHEILEKEYVGMSLMFDEKLNIIYK